MMAVAKAWRGNDHISGPYPARVEDIPELNTIFSDAFSERYRRDGLVGVRVPCLNPAIWRYAIEDAGDGALLWRDEKDSIVAFNVVHRSGAEGWMGPLAVRTDRQGLGIGKEIVRAGVELLQRGGSDRPNTIGLETMPRTMDNIGFYASLGFVPGRLTMTLTLDPASGDRPAMLFGRLRPADRDDALEECKSLLGTLLAGYDYTREIALTHELDLGDTMLWRERGRLRGFALCHTVPLVEGRSREELRVLKLALANETDAGSMFQTLADLARRSGTRRVALRVQTDYPASFQALMSLGARVRWTDLRMTVAGYPENTARQGVVWSNWEI
ncbi:MAG: GNAT family N-acetyltransferase [Gemmatimonadaceae bacterium]